MLQFVRTNVPSGRALILEEELPEKAQKFTLTVVESEQGSNCRSTAARLHLPSQECSAKSLDIAQGSRRLHFDDSQRYIAKLWNKHWPISDANWYRIFHILLTWPLKTLFSVPTSCTFWEAYAHHS